MDPVVGTVMFGPWAYGCLLSLVVFAMIALSVIMVAGITENRSIRKRQRLLRREIDELLSRMKP